MFTNVRWNEKTDVIIVCFPILDEMKRMTSKLFVSQYLMKRKEWRHNCLFPNVRWNEKNDVIIVCFPILDEMKRMTS